MSVPAVVFTGKLSFQTRKEASAEAVQHGYVVRAQVSKSANFLVCGSKVGAKKMEEARWMGLTVLTEQQWREKLRQPINSAGGAVKAEWAPARSFGQSPAAAQPSPAPTALQFGLQPCRTSNDDRANIKVGYAFAGPRGLPSAAEQVYPVRTAQLPHFQSQSACMPFMISMRAQTSRGGPRAGFSSAPIQLTQAQTAELFRFSTPLPIPSALNAGQGQSPRQPTSLADQLLHFHPVQQPTPASSAPLVVVFTGTFVHQTQEEAKALATQHGYVVHAELSSAVHYLVCGNGVGFPKMGEAFSLGVTVLSELDWRRELGLDADGGGNAMKAEPSPARPAVTSATTAWNQPSDIYSQPVGAGFAGFATYPPLPARMRTTDAASRSLKRPSPAWGSEADVAVSSAGGKRNTAEYDEEVEVLGSTKPKVTLKNGVFYEVKGSTGSTYRVKRLGQVYSCSCPAWKFQHDNPATRSCKHLRQLLGDGFEARRAGESAARSRRAVKKAKHPTNMFAVPIKGGMDFAEVASTGSASLVKVPAPDVLLAHKWDRKKNNPKGWWISEKLDGVRAFWDSRKRIFLSRLGNEYPAPSWFTEGFPSDMDLDGELFGGRGAFQITVGIAKTRGSKSWEKLVYKVFDAPSLEQKTFEQRMASAQSTVAKVSSAYIQWVEHTKCKSLAHLDEMFDQVEKLGGEGLMIREPGSLYVGGRSSSLLKIKTFHDGEAVLQAYEPGKGKYVNMVGALRCRMASGKSFKVASGLSDEDRAAPPALGSIVVYKCQELTKGGMPRFPIFLGVAADKKCAKDPVITNAAAYE